MTRKLDHQSQKSRHTLEVDRLQVRYGQRTIIRDLSVAFPPGSITSIIGPNGCGKSTLLAACSRLVKPSSGAVLLDGKPVSQLRPKSFARTVGMLPQFPLAPEGISVADLVGRGRQPHQNLFGSFSPEDYAAIARAMEVTKVADLADRAVDELSGGQKQRVWIAMVLAQHTDIILLDEPTTYLDIAHQLEILDLLTELNRTESTTVVMVLHDINLAARYSDHIVAMKDGEVLAAGAPAEIISPSLIRKVFAINSRILPDPAGAGPLISPLGRFHGAV